MAAAMVVFTAADSMEVSTVEDSMVVVSMAAGSAPAAFIIAAFTTVDSAMAGTGSTDTVSTGISITVRPIITIRTAGAGSSGPITVGTVFATGTGGITGDFCFRFSDDASCGG
ncbi:hypothetical protein [Bradyrhizobium sp. dw_78]|uniref:hypothetical protein n=1 Tax=Bradyrhizobium sp. dw_78 TaxID=2719793 RepID=UPI001BD25B9E